MGKAEVGTPKYLANKMKSKGLQKLRWYCQMCQKQCRDENGFKCHTQSESHQRQLLLFADNSGKYIHSFSKEFSDGFMELLRRRFGTKRVSSNKVYQEYISHKDHLHMNATRWLTLSDYVKWLGRSGQCIVDETEKGWFIAYIDRSPEVLEQQAKVARKEKQDKDDEERHMEFINQQVERNKKDGDSAKEVELCEFKRENDDEVVKLEIKAPKIKAESILLKPMKIEKRSVDDDDTRSVRSEKKYKPSSSQKDDGKKLSALDEIIKIEEYKKEKANRKDYWLSEGIVVKLITKSLGDKYYKQKGVVVEVMEKYRAKIKLLETGEKVKIDQSHVETVIPAVGKIVCVLNGAYRGSKATLLSLDQDNFCVTIEIAAGPLKGRVVKSVQYEDVSKLFQE
ncbi:DNA/RNA-binding protein KIN17 [Bradysia coprophila]|uniref:DNA/RNA-binding protein KIN17 n=1 Tax=Bradysia coprophila TaxID=38358 RepID=UPI00187DD83D|nr:DNA/RNA-binding protein KIN17 [Bradysia coprophila]